MSSTNRSSPVSELDGAADRDAEALLAAIRRVQAEARRDASLTCLISAPELDRVVESTVRDLWHESLIKTFVPVLALRQTRDKILNPKKER